MTDTALRYILRRGRIRLRTRHELCEVRPDGSDGGVIATIQLGEMGDEVGTVFYADPEATRPMFAFTGSILRENFEVTDDTGAVLGSFRKEWKKSFLRSTWRLTTSDGLEAVGRERSGAMALVRRVSDDILPLLVFHFDFVTSDGHVIFTCEQRRRSIWPEYELTAPLLPDGRQLDWRMAAAMGAALEIIQSR